MNKTLPAFCVLLLLTGCSSWLEIEEVSREHAREFRPHVTYEEYISGYKTADIGKCNICGRQTSSGMIKYCSHCWNRQER